VAGHLEPRQLNSFITNSLILSWKARYAQSIQYKSARLLKKLLRALEDFGAPHIDLPRVKPPHPRPTVATPEQIAALLSHAGAAMRLFVLLCWQTALRHSEAYAVSPSTWDTANRTVSIRVKGGNTRTLPVTEEIAKLLDTAAQRATDTHESCISILHGKPLAKDSVATAWRRLCKKANVEGITPHDLRRTTASQLYRVSGDLRAVQQYLGHDRLTSTIHYLAPLTEEKLRDLHRLLSFHSEVKQ